MSIIILNRVTQCKYSQYRNKENKGIWAPNIPIRGTYLHKLVDANWVYGGYIPYKFHFFCSAQILGFWVDFSTQPLYQH